MSDPELPIEECICIKLKVPRMSYVRWATYASKRLGFCNNKIIPSTNALTEQGEFQEATVYIYYSDVNLAEIELNDLPEVALKRKFSKLLIADVENVKILSIQFPEDLDD